MKTKITLHFYAKSTKANANGLHPIYVRLTVEMSLPNVKSN